MNESTPNTQDSGERLPVARDGGWEFETLAVHAGQEPDPGTGAVVPPISLATTFAQEAVGEHRGYEYSRSGNPTRTALETCLATLEGARYGVSFASGLAAEDAVLRLLSPGDHAVIPLDTYGGTYRLVDRIHAPRASATHRPTSRTPKRSMTPGAPRRGSFGSRARPIRC